MAQMFDTLAFTKRLEAGGVKRGEAEAHAEAVRELVMRDIVTKADLQAALDRQTIKMARSSSPSPARFSRCCGSTPVTETRKRPAAGRRPGMTSAGAPGEAAPATSRRQ